MAAPLPEILERFSDVLSELVVHRAVVMMTGDCARSPLMSHGTAEGAGGITSAEMASLARRVDVGVPWLGEARLGGVSRTVLASASAPPGSAGALLAVILEAGVFPAPDERDMTQLLWDLVTAHIVRLLPEAVPVQMADRWAVADERAKATAEVADVQAATLTALLITLRSKTLDDTAARRAATDSTVSALLELRTSMDHATHDETAEAAFARLADTLSTLTRYSDVELDLSGPEGAGRSLPADVAKVARATVRDTVVTMLEQGKVSRLRVAWKIDDAMLRLVIRDNGAGEMSTEALSMHRIASRLLSIEGTLEFDSSPNWGTTVSVSIPLSPPELLDATLLSSLNPRELDVLEQLTYGRRNREIASRLHISEHTVKFHVANIFGKLGVRSRGEAAAVAREAGLPGVLTLTRFPGGTAAR
ncbi:LuxR C-terminal-related transcriptional regulator [Amycolatopsis sp. cmx-11-12]|uniref:helix-turn-helix transcriptional regulator n=1 Tax=Amycolatopsis sp. cmx-11-12 TaxID=2785795 RepID=UPI00391835A3